ncbi:transglutaminase family protein [Microcoleus sp. FACHB-1515]|uniref:transglutaminase family protein n=1 Tax=Cyanophyceae TaxID=3028117 RepID=UPI00168774DB|nr:transglutaminase family protein [Microcoleus sp. FACHB-1515]MBD2092264.1 transglutaminase family protein [Microcoleus sp. FACHB-1515]
MRYKIQHRSIYTYSAPVSLAPHVLRLRPRCDAAQQVHSFHWAIDPQPARLIENLDLDGNQVTQISFAAAIESLTIMATSEVETFRTNPFDFLLEPWATSLPIDYPISLSIQLQPYLTGYLGSVDPVAIELAQEIFQATQGNTIAFLTELNQRIYKTCRYELRESGDPYPAGITWRSQQGSCRDFAVLFCEVCRAINLAARFVSGYQEGDPDQTDGFASSGRDLHAWAEVYLPGAGWRGYDPTQGLAVSDRHVALCASPSPRQTAPIAGTLKTVGVQSHFAFELQVQAIDSADPDAR